MKFKVERSTLAAVIIAAGRAVATRSGSMPVLTGVHMRLVGDRLTVTGTDLELSVQASCVVSGVEDGACVLPSRLIGDVIRAMKAGAVTFDVDGTEARIVSGRSSFTVLALNADDFPKVDMTEEASPVVLPGAYFGPAVARCVGVASADDSRPIITGLLFESEGAGIRLVATDSYRLAVADLPIAGVLTGDRTALIPARALAELVKLAGDSDVTVRLGVRQVSFTAGDVTLITRLIEGAYPAYRRLIPTNQPNRLKVDRVELVDAIKRIKLLARDGVPITFVMTENELTISAVTQDVGRAIEVLDAAYTGMPLTISFNPDYMIAAASSVECNFVAIDTSDALKPALVVNPDADGNIHLLMPTKVA